MFKIPYLSEKIELPEGDKTPPVYYELRDGDNNVIDLSGHTLSAELKDSTGSVISGLSVSNNGAGFNVILDATSLTAGTYYGLIRDETDSTTLLWLTIEVTNQIGS